jgi:hypothetical protein
VHHSAGKPDHTIHVHHVGVQRSWHTTPSLVDHRPPHTLELAQSWALAEAAAGNERAARERFQGALRVAPNSGACYNAWALFEAGLGNEQQAREVWQDGATADPTHVPLLHVSYVPV